MNSSLSKSEAKGLGCEYYYRKYYVERVPQHEMPWTRTGTEFHGFMEKYVKYLVGANLMSDLDWVRVEMDGGAYSDEARDLIRRYAAEFLLRDPMAVIGVEAFLVVDADLKPIPLVAYPGVGKRPKVIGAYAHGTIDRVEKTGVDAIEITDYKTGFLPQRVDEYEAKHYALLAMCHYPWAQTVTFTWDFIRFGSRDSLTFTRDDYPELTSALKRKLAMRSDVLAGHLAVEPAGCNSLAGLCGYCALLCPMRAEAVQGNTIYRPIQTDEDAALAASTLAAIRSAKATLETQLKNYLGKAGTVSLGGGNAAYLETRFSPVLGARTVLATLGIEVPEKSEQYDVDLDKLVINNTEFKRLAAARKRAGLLDTVMASAPTKPRTDLVVGQLPVE